MHIHTLPAFRAVGIRIRTTPFSSEIPALWQRFMPYMDSIQTITPGISYGLMGEHNDDGSYTYMAALAVADDSAIDPALDTWHVPAQRYAVFEATIETLGATYEQIHGQIMPTSGLQYGQGPSLEYYGPAFDTPAQTLHIYVAIQ